MPAPGRRVARAAHSRKLGPCARFVSPPLSSRPVPETFRATSRLTSPGSRTRAARVSTSSCFPSSSLTDYQLSFDVLALALAADGPELHELAAAGGRHARVRRLRRGEPGRHLLRLPGAPVRRSGCCPSTARPRSPINGRSRTRGISAAAAARAASRSGGPWRLATIDLRRYLEPGPALARRARGRDFVRPCRSRPPRTRWATISRTTSGWDVNLRHCALTYGLPVVMANHCGERDGVRFWGGSCILDARGRVLAKAGAEPQLVVAEVSYADVRRARSLLADRARCGPAPRRAAHPPAFSTARRRDALGAGFARFREVGAGGASRSGIAHEVVRPPPRRARAARGPSRAGARG